jgi:flagellar biosynthetic protein FliP
MDGDLDLRTTTDAEQPAAAPDRPVARFLWHFAEMVLAMLAGMLLLGPIWMLAWPHLHTQADLHVLVMATDMAIGMAAWMRFRRHGWAAIAQMSAAMYVPFLLLLGPYWADMISGATLSTAGHILMIPCMLAVMLLRRDEYTHRHPGHPAA